MSQIKLVVSDENILGYIFDEQPTVLNILHASILKGATAGRLAGWTFIGNIKLRPASEKDFDEYRVCFNGYKNDPIYEYAKN